MNKATEASKPEKKSVVINAFYRLFQEDIFNWAASLSYYTIFSLPPSLFLVVMILGAIIGDEVARDSIQAQFANFIGEGTTEQIFQTIDRIGVFEYSGWTSFVSIGILLFTSTTVFVTLQQILNKIFKVRVKQQKGGFFRLLKDRLLSLALLVGMAFILLLSLIVEAVAIALGSTLEEIIGETSYIISLTSSLIIPFLINTAFIALLFKFLPDVELRWRDTLLGAFVTALLFAVGRYGIGFYISNSQMTSMYAAAGSLMIILLWVFYASVIFILGAIITHELVRKKYGYVKAKPYAVHVIEKEIERS